MVLVPFYRGTVVFERGDDAGFINITLFSSPFIEERLYLVTQKVRENVIQNVLVPFYRGPVVFN